MDNSVRWVDTHCHPQLTDDGKGAIARAFSVGVRQMICVGTDVDTSREAVEVAKAAGQGVFATVGLHPHDAINGTDTLIALLDEQIAKSPELIVGIGECGLDYYYDHSPHDIQKEVFRTQIRLAKQFDLALVIHTRDAWDDTFEILRSEGVPPRTVVHCFTGGAIEAQTAVELGMYLSFSGIVTFPKSVDVQAAADFCPTDRLLIETDSPYLAPVPLRGKPNEPANVVRIGEYLAARKDMQVAEFARVITANSQKVFALHN